jgi:prolipoprotein diacylglyceryltransferase
LHFPVTISIGSWQVPLHNITELIGIFIGFRYFIYLRRKNGDAINSPNRVWILIAAIFGSFIGSRLIGGLENPGLLKQANNLFIYFYENKTVLGGFLGGLFAVEAAKKMISETKASGDLFVFPIILALIIGRIGCFSMGVYEETYGTPTLLPWGMDLGDGQKRHPVALYEILFLFLLWILIVQTEKKWKLENGARFKIFMMAYISFRFILDFIKPHYTFNIGLSTIQLTCIVGFVWYIKYFLHPKKLLVEETKNIESVKANVI